MKTGKILLTAAAAMFGLSGCYYYPPPPPVMVGPAPGVGIVVPAPSIVAPVAPRYRDHYYHGRHHDYRYGRYHYR
jgi:hypothetical protein